MELELNCENEHNNSPTGKPKCGACSEEKFFDSDEYYTIKGNFAISYIFGIFGIAILVFCVILALVQWIKNSRGTRHFYD